MKNAEIAATSSLEPVIPPVAPHLIGEDVWLVPNLVPSGPGTFLNVNSMVIRGDQPVVVDTGAPVHRDNWLEQVFSLVDPDDVRWIYLSHDDGDQCGNLHELLEWLDPIAYGRHIGALEALAPTAIASAHGPVLRGDAIADAFGRVRAMAGQPVRQPPGQELLDELVAASAVVS